MTARFLHSYLADKVAVSQDELAEFSGRLPQCSEAFARRGRVNGLGEWPEHRSFDLMFSSRLAPFSVAICLAAALTGTSSSVGAVVTYTMPDSPQYTTVAQAPPGAGEFANNGIWLTMTNGTPLIVSDNSFPGYVDGQFQLQTISYSPPAGSVLVQGFIANGNDVAVQGTGSFPSNPAYIPFGGTVGADSSFIGGASFTAMSGSFGNWNSATPLRGALGVKFPAGGNTHYGYIDVTQQTDGTITLHGYAYNDVPGAPITTAAVPEPTCCGWLMAIGLPLAVANIRRRP
jgi:hypothetical protein